MQGMWFRRPVVGSVVIVALGAAWFGSLGVGAQTSHEVTAALVDEWTRELSNWGRWGQDDQLGTVNLITPENRRRALDLAREGITVSLSHNYITEEAEDAPLPFGHEMLGLDTSGPFRSDRYTVAYHGGTHSHMDSLCHMSHEGRMYNGFVRDDEVTAAGCQKLGIENFKQGVISRGILLDIPRLKELPYLEPGVPIYVEDLEAWEQQAGVRVESGDIVFVRTGRWARRADRGPWSIVGGAAGLHASVAPWLHARGVAILGSDAVNDVFPSGIEGASGPIHLLTIATMGMPLFDNLDLEAVAAEAVRQNRWEFLLVAAPLAVEGGTGSPLNPLAIF